MADWRDRFREGDEYAFRPSTWKPWRKIGLGLLMIGAVVRIVHGPFEHHLPKPTTSMTVADQPPSSTPHENERDRPSCRSIAVSYAMATCGVQASEAIGANASGFDQSEREIRAEGASCPNALSMGSRAGMMAYGDVVQSLPMPADAPSGSRIAGLCSSSVGAAIEDSCQNGACDQ